MGLLAGVGQSCLRDAHAVVPLALHHSIGLQSSLAPSKDADGRRLDPLPPAQLLFSPTPLLHTYTQNLHPLQLCTSSLILAHIGFLSY